MFKKYRLKNQPEECYLAGHGIGREGNPKEWTPTSRVRTEQDWDNWSYKAVHWCRWRNLFRIEKIDGVWFWIILNKG